MASPIDVEAFIQHYVEAIGLPHTDTYVAEDHFWHWQVEDIRVEVSIEIEEGISCLHLVSPLKIHPHGEEIILFQALAEALEDDLPVRIVDWQNTCALLSIPLTEITDELQCHRFITRFEDWNAALRDTLFAWLIRLIELLANYDLAQEETEKLAEQLLQSFMDPELYAQEQMEVDWTPESEPALHTQVIISGLDDFIFSADSLAELYPLVADVFDPDYALPDLPEDCVHEADILAFMESTLAAHASDAGGYGLVYFANAPGYQAFLVHRPEIPLIQEMARQLGTRIEPLHLHSSQDTIA